MNRRPPTRRKHRRSAQDNLLLSTRVNRRLPYVNRPQQVPAVRGNSRLSTRGEVPVILTGYYQIHTANGLEVQE